MELDAACSALADGDSLADILAALEEEAEAKLQEVATQRESLLAAAMSQELCIQRLQEEQVQLAVQVQQLTAEREEQNRYGGTCQG